MRKRCGCRSKCCDLIAPVEEYEIAIGSQTLTPNESTINKIYPQTDIQLLKDKVICEYRKIISRIEKGQYLDLEFLLEEISVIGLEDELDKREFIIQHYLNTYEY